MSDVAVAPTTKPKPPLTVIAAGVATSVAMLAAVYWLNTHTEANPMGWYLNYVIPAGALIVGLLASSGYGIGSWLSGVKIQRGLLVTIVLLSIVAYFGAQYMEFLSMGPLFHVDTNEPVGFWEYYHINAINFAWTGKDGKPGEALGWAGYIFRSLEAIGFVGGTLIAPVILKSKPYCEACQQYMTYKALSVVPASVPARKVKKKDVEGTEALAKENAAAADHADQVVNELRGRVAADDAEGVARLITLTKAGSKPAGKLPLRVEVGAQRCTSCQNGWIQLNLQNGHGKEMSTTPLPQIDVPARLMPAVISSEALVPTA